MLPPLSARIGLLSCGWAVFFLTSLAVQTMTCQGGEYPISGAVAGDQISPAVALSSSGGFVVWEDNQIEGGQGKGIGAIRVDGDFNPEGTIFKANQSAPGDQTKPQIVRLANGSFLCSWEVSHGPKAGVYTRILGANGVFQGTETLLSASGSKETVKQSVLWPVIVRNKLKDRRYKFREKLIHFREHSGQSAVDATADGGALIAYHANRRTETNTWMLVTNVYWSGIKAVTNTLFRPTRRYRDWMQDVFVQKVDNLGRKVGSEIRVNQSAEFNQRNPSMTTLVNGNVMVVWVSESHTGAKTNNSEIKLCGRLLNSQGEPVGEEFVIVSEPGTAVANPSIASRAAGGFVVGWSRRVMRSNDGWDVFAQVRGEDGSALGEAFRVNDHVPGNQFAPRLVATGTSCLAVWTTGQDGSREEVYGRWLTGDAVAGSEFRLNDTLAGRQFHPAVASDEDGRVLGIWSSYEGETGFNLLGRKLVNPVSPSIP